MSLCAAVLICRISNEYFKNKHISIIRRPDGNFYLRRKKLVKTAARKGKRLTQSLYTQASLKTQTSLNSNALNSKALRLNTLHSNP